MCLTIGAVRKLYCGKSGLCFFSIEDTHLSLMILVFRIPVIFVVALGPVVSAACLSYQSPDLGTNSVSVRHTQPLSALSSLP